MLLLLTRTGNGNQVDVGGLRLGNCSYVDNRFEVGFINCSESTKGSLFYLLANTNISHHLHVPLHISEG